MLNEKLINDEHVYSVYYDSTLDAVVMEWNGYARSEEFRAGTELMLQTMKTYKTGKVLGNITDFTLIAHSDQHWMIYNLLPRAIENGFSKCALTIPSYYFNKVAVEHIISQIPSDKLQVKLFNTVKEARSWIEEPAG